MKSTVPPPKEKRPDPLVGTVVNGKFRVLSVVAAGGMGKIYQAEQLALARMVALKVLRASADPEDDDPQFRKRFLREASILARLQHPNIVTVFDYGAIEGGTAERYFISMEYISGVTLARRIADTKGLGTKDTIRIGKQIARGLAEAHAQGVIHRDLKPSNVMILQGRNGEELVKIVDFGIGKVVGEAAKDDDDLTEDGSFVGSPKYTAPEQILPDGTIDARTDIYSFGVILYECLTGLVPFDGGGTIQTLMAQVNEQARPVRERAPLAAVPEWLEDFVMSCMEKAPEKRPATMEAVVSLLTEAELLGPDRLEEGGSPGSTSGATTARRRPVLRQSDPTRATPQLMPKQSRPSRRAVGLVGAVSVGVLALVGVWVRSRPVALAGTGSGNTPSAPAPAASAIGRFPLRIESTPDGVQVREGDRVLGVTPLELMLENEGLREVPRKFVLAKDGFSPYPIVQGPSEDRVQVVAQLVPIPSAVASSAAPTVQERAVTAIRVGGHTPAQSSAHPATAGTRPPPPALDIRMTR